jgi:hypothetical protein
MAYNRSFAIAQDDRKENMSWVGTKRLFANFSIGHAHLIDPSCLRMTGKLDMSWARTKDLFANFSIGHAQLIDPSYLRMTGKWHSLTNANKKTLEKWC